jgi:PhoH-like ATPase
MPADWDLTKADNNIIRIAKGLSEKFSDRKVILVTKDAIVRIKATTVNVVSEDYDSEVVEDEDLVYSGRCLIEVAYDEIETFYSTRKLKLTDERIKSYNLKENEYITLVCGTATALGRYTEGCVVGLKYENEHPCDITLLNSGQKFAAEALLAPAEEVPLVILKGPAGTAKTFLTLACGLSQIMVKRPDYRKLLLTRANVAFDNDLGALPGDEIDKVSPLLRGCLDNIELILDKDSVKIGGEKAEYELQDKVREVFDRGYVSIEALGYLRGRSITNQYVLIDEAQNTSPNQMLGILTRAGEGTKIVICGDLDQIDNTKLDKHTNGLAFALKSMAGSKLCHIVGFSDKETTRSPLAKEAANRMVM